MLSLKPGRYHLHADPALRPHPFRHHLHHLNEILLRSLLRVPGHDRLILSLPPRHSKTSFSSYFIAAWMGTYPTDNVLTYSYSSRLATKQAAYIHDLFRHYGPSHLSLSLSPSTRSKSHFSTTGGGSLFASSMMGSAGGLDASGLLVIDDYTKSVTQAGYPSEREKNWHYWVSTLRQRIQSNTCVLVIASRTHSDDLSGRLLNPEFNPEAHTWRHIKLPLLAQEGDPLGRPPGVTLCPEIYSQALADSQRLSTPPSLFEIVYQGSPENAPDDSVEWDASYFSDPDLWVPHLPADSQLRVMAVDPSLGKTRTSDPAAIVKLAITRDQRYHAQADVARRPIPLLAKAIIDQYLSFQPHALVIEDNGFQALLLDYISLLLKEMGLPSIPIIGVTNNGHLGAKHVRIKWDLSHPIQNRLFRFVDDFGTKDLVDQLRNFHPKMSHDDAADALSLAVRIAQQLAYPRNSG